ncbi:aldehyde dehydrogenase family 3 member B1-like [Physella acuta]|uniref:aldehyde dehydrogenase family 3 member B1-like n=1 Tax=Physella acuta TaxID=109671 RepID=UPI0027DB090D|nr:aldehyde dehydrogenase family 3 member B1-like [Physella acuta]
MATASLDFGQVVKELRTSFASGKTKDRKWRESQLKGIVRLFEENESKIQEVLYKDLHKHKAEGAIMESVICINDAIHAINSLSDWMKPEKVAKGAIYMMDSAYVHKEPLGVTLIIGAWNYPIQLTMLPLIGAIAAGNCAVIKPSEMAEASAKFIEEYLPKYVDNDCIRVINGAVKETTELLKLRFDHIFYTGNSMVGKIVMEAAAKYLTPVILELGGKSPVYVDKDTNLEVVARRLCWGKFCNAGQTCIAPDYVMCPRDIQDELIKNVKSSIEEFYTKDPKSSDSFGRIINQRHFQRLQNLKKGGTVAYEGEDDEKECYICPTVFKDVKLTDPIMQEEIFGPLLPLVPVKDHDEAIDIINGREKPLSLYIFTNNKHIKDDFRLKTSSGALVINDTVVHAGLPSLPFGGVGNSGMGSYHGKFSFDAFSHNKPVLDKSLGMDQVNALRYPPYTEKKLGWIRWIMQKKVKKTGFLGFMPFVAIGLVFSMFFKVIGASPTDMLEQKNK